MSGTCSLRESAAADAVPPYAFQHPEGFSWGNPPKGTYLPPREDSKFGRYLREVLVCFAGATREQAAAMVTSRGRAIFAEALTHRSADQRSYEVYEKMGDRFVNMTIVDLLVEMYPELQRSDSQGYITTLENTIKSNAVLSTFSEKMHLLPWVASSWEARSEDPVKMRADAFEAFVQAVRFTAAEAFPKTCLRVDLPTNIVRNMFSRLNLVMTRAGASPPKTILLEEFKNTGIEVRDSTREVNGKYLCKVFLVIRKGERVLVGEAVSRDKKIAITEAHRRALFYLIEHDGAGYIPSHRVAYLTKPLVEVEGPPPILAYS